MSYNRYEEEYEEELYEDDPLEPPLPQKKQQRRGPDVTKQKTVRFGGQRSVPPTHGPSADPWKVPGQERVQPRQQQRQEPPQKRVVSPPPSRGRTDGYIEGQYYEEPASRSQHHRVTPPSIPVVAQAPVYEEYHTPLSALDPVTHYAGIGLLALHIIGLLTFFGRHLNLIHLPWH